LEAAPGPVQSFVVVEALLSPVEAAAGFGAGVVPDDSEEPAVEEPEEEPPSPDPPAGAVAGVDSAVRDDEPPDRLSVL
jgi:hypothetical protein